MSMLIRLYPQAWRDRYETEILDLLAERPGSVRDAVNLVRGAVDAHLHPNVSVVAPEPGPWTHRLPGLLALAAGLMVTFATLSISAGAGPDWGVAGNLLGIAFLLMLVSLPGEYLAPYGRQMALAFSCIVVGVVSASATNWWQPAILMAIGAEVAALSGLLAVAAIRAGVGSGWRWLLVQAGVLGPLAIVAGITALREWTGIALVDVAARTTALFGLPYGLAWLVVGLRMMVRGSATFTDPPDHPAPAPEGQPA